MAEPLYQPTVTNGNVTPYVPPGQSYTPTQYTLPTAQYSALPFANPGAINIQGESGFPSFSFDFSQEIASAYNQLKPFYEKLLAFAGGDLDLAKRIMEYTYQQGFRETGADRAANQREQAITFPKETSQQMTEQNRRGVLTSGFGATDRANLQESQALRKEAAERALQNREANLTADRGFGMEKAQSGFQQTAFEQERARRGEASDQALSKFNIKSVQYQGELAKKQREEERRIREEQARATAGVYGGGGGGSFDPSKYRDYATYLAETGQQSTLDAMRRSGQNI